MKRTDLTRATVLSLIMMLAASGCGSKLDQLCCLQYPMESEKATYCNNMRNAVLKFVRAVPEASERQQRLAAFEVFYASIEDCKTVECIDSAVETAPNLPGLRDRYETERSFSDQDTEISDAQKPELIRCGFKHAIDGMKKTL